MKIGEVTMASKSGQVPSTRKHQQRKRQHPYEAYTSSFLWRIVDRGIGDLVKNGDLREMAPREYVVGYLCKLLDKDIRLKSK